jgi:hypothetical protein
VGDRPLTLLGFGAILDWKPLADVTGVSQAVPSWRHRPWRRRRAYDLFAQELRLADREILAVALLDTRFRLIKKEQEQIAFAWLRNARYHSEPEAIQERGMPRKRRFIGLGLPR